MFNFLKDIYNYSKSFFSKKGGLASLQAYAPFGTKPTPEQQQLIKTYPQLSSPPPKTGLEVFKVPSVSSPQPEYTYIPPKASIPMSGDTLLASPVTAPPQVPSPEAQRINAESPTPFTAPLPVIPQTSPAQFATAEPSVILEPTPQISGASTTSGISAPSSAPSAPSAPSGGSSGYFSGFSPTTLYGFAQSMGVASNRINPTTGEIINPTQKEIDEFNKRYKTTKVPEPITSPVSAPELKTAAITTPILPTTTASTSNEAYFASISADLERTRKTVEDAYNKQLADLKIKVDESNKQIADITAQQQGALGNIETLSQPFRKDLEDKERERLYITKNFEENQKLTDELASLLTEGNALITQQRATPGVTTGIMERKVAKTMNDITARAGVIQATLAARNNQISQAYNLIDRSVKAIDADRTDQINYYKTLYNFYENQKDTEGKKLITLTSDQKTYLNSQIKLLEDDLKQSQTNAENIKKAMTDPDTALAFAEAGITLNDTPQQMNVKLANRAYIKDIADKSNEFSQKGYSYLGPGQSAPANSEVVPQFDSKGYIVKHWYKKKTTSDTTNVAITPDDKRNLQGAGFSADEIPQIISDINTYGLNKTLEGITDPNQKKALQKIYGVEEETKLTRESISSLYGLPDNNERTNWLGSFGVGKTNKEKLDDIMKSIKQYQDVGMSDSEILTIIKKG